MSTHQGSFLVRGLQRQLLIEWLRLIVELQNQASAHIKVKKGTDHVFCMATPSHTNESVFYMANPCHTTESVEYQ